MRKVLGRYRPPIIVALAALPNGRVSDAPTPQQLASSSTKKLVIHVYSSHDSNLNLLCKLAGKPHTKKRKMKTEPKNKIRVDIKNSLGILIVIFAGFLLFAKPIEVFAQGAKDTENTADKNLKSSARINPSTLAMEFSLPLMGYAGRNGSSIPVSYSYSSKLWQMEMFRTWMWNSSTTIDLNAIFAKNTAAGWASCPPLKDKRESKLLSRQPPGWRRYRQSEKWQTLCD